MKISILLITILAYIAMTLEVTSANTAFNHTQPVTSSDVDLISGFDSQQPETNEIVTTPHPNQPTTTPRPIPPNRKRPIIPPDRNVVVGVSVHDVSQLSGSDMAGLSIQKESRLRNNGRIEDIRTSISHETKPQKAIISKSDVIMAVVDGMGAIADMLADSLADDINSVVNTRPGPGTPAPVLSSGKKTVGESNETIETSFKHTHRLNHTHRLSEIGPVSGFDFSTGLVTENGSNVSAKSKDDFPEQDTKVVAEPDPEVSHESGDEFKRNQASANQLAIQDMVEAQAETYLRHILGPSSHDHRISPFA
jgi:hypothetical protein